MIPLINPLLGLPRKRVVVSLTGLLVLICDLYTCGIWVESVDPMTDLCPTNQFLYQTVRSGTAE